jgi:4-aminobutyrate aminotransferase
MSLQARQHLSPVWTHLTRIVVERGEGAYLYTEDGTRYLDFTCGIGVTNTGHCHSRVVAKVQEQAARLLHGQANILFHRPMLELVSELQTVTPQRLDGFFFSNSGAEAVEASVKLARQATGRPNVIVFQGSFHGRTVGTMSMTTSKTVYRAGYQPLMPGVFVAPYPYSYRYGWTDEETMAFCLRELDFLLHSQTAPEETAAIVIEPVLGEGGYVVPPPGFLRALRDICDAHGILLVLDEVQSGFGRTGKFFALEHFGVEPDIMIMAKGLASGLPLSAIAAPLALMERWVPGSHGGTYGGNAVACAAAAETVRIIRDEELLDNAVRMGEHLMQGLRSLQAEHPVVGDVRGLGLMVAVEFTGVDGQQDKAFAAAVQNACLEDRLLLLTCGTYGNVIRWIPPLVVNAGQIDTALETFGRALKKTGR